VPRWRTIARHHFVGVILNDPRLPLGIFVWACVGWDRFCAARGNLLHRYACLFAAVKSASGHRRAAFLPLCGRHSSAWKVSDAYALTSVPAYCVNKYHVVFYVSHAATRASVLHLRRASGVLFYPRRLIVERHDDKTAPWRSRRLSVAAPPTARVSQLRLFISGMLR